MNRYQRKKAKRMRKLVALGVSYSCQKHILRNYNFDQVDKMIEQITLFKNSGILAKMKRIMTSACNGLMKLIIDTGRIKP